MHNAIDAVVAHAQQHRQFAMPKGIIQFMPLLDGHSDLLIFERSLGLQVQTASRELKCTHHLALAVGAIGSRQLMGQFHLLGGF